MDGTYSFVIFTLPPRIPYCMRRCPCSELGRGQGGCTSSLLDLQRGVKDSISVSLSRETGDLPFFPKTNGVKIVQQIGTGWKGNGQWNGCIATSANASPASLLLQKIDHGGIDVLATG